MGEEVLANHLGRRAAAPAVVMQASGDDNDRPGSWPNIGQLVPGHAGPTPGRVGAALAAVVMLPPASANATRPTAAPTRAKRPPARRVNELLPTPDICPSS